MLRKKLFLVLGSVIALMLCAAVVAVLLLQSVLSDLEHFAEDAFSGTAKSIAVQQQLTSLETTLEQSMMSGSDLSGLACTDLAANIQNGVAQIAQLGVVQGDAAPRFAKLVQSAELLNKHLQPIVLSGVLSRDDHDLLLQSTSDVRAQLMQVHEEIQAHAQIAEQRTIARFRWVALGLGLAFVLVINISIMVLARMTSMILRPVDQLVAASRRMACEDFDCRIDLPQQDEFGELAHAFNTLAVQLQANEQRKIETLHQVARMLNHELINAIAIIQLQLDRTARGSQGDRIQAEPLREIHEALSRMTSIVSSLTRVRRIVLTDYLSGMKMLDLDASVAEESAGITESTASTLVHHAGPA